MSNPERNRESLQFDIHGMSCAGCVRNVEKALMAVPGVTGASVNFAAQTATVNGHASPGQLIAAVNDAGYEASVVVDISAEEEARQISQAFRLASLRSAAALALAALLMLDMWFGLLPSIDATGVWLVIATISLALMWFAGGHFYRGAFSAARHGATTMDTLVALGTATAWVYSVIVVLVPDILPSQSRHQFFEAALFVIGFVNLGKALEIRARARSSLAIRQLFDLAPKVVDVVEQDQERTVSIDDVQPGMLVRIRPGDVVPIDGCVIEGEGAFDESLLTGESEPVEKEPGSGVSAGTVCLDSSLIVEASGVGSETRLAGIARLVRQAQDSKPRIARLVDRVTSVFVPLVLGVAIVTGLAWWLFGPEPRLSMALVTSMSVLIIACPCALGLAVPMSVMVGLGRAAEQGLLVRNSEVLQAASVLDVVVLDKTGTLTKGEPNVTEIQGLDIRQLEMVRAVEARSEHPLASAIVRHLDQYSNPEIAVENFHSHAGGGVSANIDGLQILIGSLRFVGAHGLSVLEPEGAGSVVYVAIGGQIAGYIVLMDEPRAEAMPAVSELNGKGVRTIMLSGDRQAIAESVGQQVGISEVHAGMTPEGKLEFIEELQSMGLSVGMVGDGINDAAALAQADVSFAMGKGAAVAMETSDVTLLKNDLGNVARAIELSRKVLSNMHQNLFAAFTYNVLLIPVAAGALYWLDGFLLNPGLAGLAMAMSSVSVVFNAGRLRFV